MTASVSGEAVHSNQRPYSVTVAPGSTVFSDAVGFAFESDEADFSSFGLVGTGAPETIRTGTISLLFTADPGFAFTSASLDFDDIGWLNASFGGHYLHTGSWTISAGTYVGDASGTITRSSLCRRSLGNFHGRRYGVLSYKPAAPDPLSAKSTDSFSTPMSNIP